MKFHWQILIALGLGAKRNWHIFIALIMGVVAGLLLNAYLPIDEGVLPQDSHPVYQFLYVIGQIFIRLIEMIVIPLVVSSLVLGISSLGDGRQLGRLGSKVLFFFILTTTIASISGAILAITFQPGKQLKDEFASYSVSQSENIKQKGWDIQQQQSNRDYKEVFLSMIPSNPVKALSNSTSNNSDAAFIPVIIFSVIFGAALTFIGDTSKPLLQVFEAIFAATMKVMDWVMVFAVPGIFALTANTIAASGLKIFSDLSIYIGVVLFGLFLQLFVVFPLLLKFFAKVDFRTLYKAVVEAMMVGFGTASSSATLPVTIATCERRAGISNRITSFVLPLGVTMNKDGTAVFEAIAVIFLAQVYGVDVSNPVTLILLIVMGIIASIAAAGVPSAGLVTMSVVLGTVGGLAPYEIAQGVGVLWMIDRVLDMCRTLVNVTSDTVVATIIAASEGELDYDLLNNQDAWRDVV